MKTPVNLLYLEDDEMDQQIFLHMVREQGLPYQLEMVQTLSEARARLAQTSFDVIVADYYLPDGCGTELLDDIQNTPFILLTGSLEEQLALRTLARGADDYLPKDQQQRYLKALPFAVEKSLYRQSLRQTEQRLTRELGERGEQLRLVLDTVQVRVFWKDLNSVYLGCNRTFLRDAGLGSPEEIIGKTDYQMVWREQAELYREDDRRVMETGQPKLNYEEPQTGPDGRHLWVRTSKIPLRDYEGRIIGVLGTYEDITEKKRAEEALRRSESLYRTMAHSIPGGAMSVVDQDLRYIIVEGPLLARLGLNKQAMVGRTVQEVFEGEIGRSRAEHFRRAFAGEITSYETEYHGHIVWSQFAPLRDPDGRVLAAMSLGMDVTERKRAEEALRTAKEELARSNQELERRVDERTAKLREAMAELEQLSYSMIHDLRAPLRAIQSFGGILEGDPGSQLSPEGRELLAKMRVSASRMDQLVVDVLNYSRVLRGELPLRAVDVGAVVRGIVETYPNLGPTRAEVQVAPDLPVVVGNSAALTQCLANLISNAVKFAKPGQMAKVQVKSERGENGRVRIVVEDNGVGIAPEFQEKVFGLFERLDNAGEGTGMGLAIVKKAAERMGGRVGVESELGKGSRFWVELSRAEHKASGAT